MKHFRMLLLAVMGLFASCESQDGPDDFPPVICPIDVTFQFDDNGIPHPQGQTHLCEELQRSLREQIIGYGWRWVGTNEIKRDKNNGGTVISTDYYSEMIGAQPNAFLNFQTETTLTEYFYSDALGQSCFRERDYTLDPVSGLLSYDTSVFGQRYIWSVFGLEGRWYFECVEPLGVRDNDDGTMITIWGTTAYARITSADIEQVQKEFTFDYSTH